MLTISCNVLKTILKVKNSMVVSVLVVYLRDHALTGCCGVLPVCSIMRSRLHNIDPGKQENSNSKTQFPCSTYHFCTFSSEKIIESNDCKSRTVYSSRIGQVPYDAHLKRKKEHTQNLKQGKIFPHKVLSPAEAMRTLHLWGRKCPRPKAHS